jgi:carbamoyltransferase
LGPGYENNEIIRFLRKNGYLYQRISDEELPNRIADLLADEKVVGWYQGRMEFGPRALGSRSIIGDARSAKIQKTMNLKIKYRESFRPFAPSVLAENVCEYFELDRESPYMLLVANVRKEKQIEMTEKQKKYFGVQKLNVVRSEIPAVTHVNYSARVQSVNKKINPKYHEMISKFYEKHGCPVIVNTSFNVRGEPIVCTPEDAYRCFMRTEMDYLVMGSYLLDKQNQQPLENDIDWRQKFEMD